MSSRPILPKTSPFQDSNTPSITRFTTAQSDDDDFDDYSSHLDRRPSLTLSSSLQDWQLPVRQQNANDKTVEKGEHEPHFNVHVSQPTEATVEVSHATAATAILSSGQAAASLEPPLNSTFRAFSFHPPATNSSIVSIVVPTVPTPSPGTEITTPRPTNSDGYFQQEEPEQYVPQTPRPTARPRIATTNSSEEASDSHSSIGSHPRWFKKREPDLRLLDYADEQSVAKQVTSASALVPLESPRITSFRTEHEHERNVRGTTRHSRRSSKDCSVDTSKSSSHADSGQSSGLSDPKRPSSVERPLLKFIGRWSSRASRQSRSDTNSDPIISVTPPVDDSPHSPASAGSDSSWHQHYSNQGAIPLIHSAMESAQLARSRRYGLSSEDSEGNSPRLHTPPANKGRLPLRRPRLGRFHSSPHSPKDTSKEAMNNSNLIQPVAASAPLLPTIASTRLPSFLSPEANRVHTPPKAKHKPSKEEKIAGYFWGTRYSEDSVASDARSLEHQVPPARSPASLTIPQSPRGAEDDRDWYRLRLDRIMNDLPSRDSEDLRMFDWDVPEHLPNSPLCPLNPKHRDGGVGICVYHGRRGNPQNSIEAGAELWK